MKIKYLLIFIIYLQNIAFSNNIIENNWKTGIRAYNDKLYNYAISKFKKIVNHPSDFKYKASALYYLSISYYEISNYNQAKKYLSTFIKNYPQSKFQSSAKYFLGCTYFKQNRNKDSQKILSTITSSKISNQVNFKLGEILSIENDYTNALKAWGKVGGIYSINAKLNMVKLYLNQNQIDLIFPLLENINDALKNNQDALIKAFNKSTFIKWKENSLSLKIKSHLKANDFEKALKSIKQFSNLYSNSLLIDENRFLEGYIYFLKNEYQKAITYFEKIKILLKEPFYKAQMLYYKAISYKKLNQNVLAIAIHKKIFLEYPNSDFAVKSAYVLSQYYDQEKSNFQKGLVYLNKLADSKDEEYYRYGYSQLIEKKLENSLHRETIDLRQVNNLYQKWVKKETNEIHKTEATKWYIKILFNKNHPKTVQKANSIIQNSSYLTPNKVQVDADILFFKADYFFNLNEYKKSKNILLEIQKHHPNYKPILIKERIAYCLKKTENYEEALKIYKELSQLNSKDHEKTAKLAKIIQAEIYENQNAVEKEKNIYKNYLKEYTNDDSTRHITYKLARLYYKEKKYLQAINLFNQITNHQDEISLKSIYWIGWAYYKQKENTKAYRHFYQLKNFNLKSSYQYEGLLIAGQIDYQRKNYKKASILYTYIINNYKGNNKALIANTYFELGQCFIELNDLAQCEYFYQKLMTYYPNQISFVFQAYISLINYYYERKILNKTLQHLKKTVDFLNVNKSKNLSYLIEVYYIYLDIYSENNQWGKRIKIIQILLPLVTDDIRWDIEYEKAVTYNHLNQNFKSIKILEKIANQTQRQDLAKLAQKQLNNVQSQSQIDRVKNAKTLSDLLILKKDINSLEAKQLLNYKLGKILLNSKHNKERKQGQKYLEKISQQEDQLSSKAQLLLIPYFYNLKDYENCYSQGIVYYYINQIKNEELQNIFWMVCISAGKLEFEEDAKKLSNEYKIRFPNSKYLKQLTPYLN